MGIKPTTATTLTPPASQVMCQDMAEISVVDSFQVLGLKTSTGLSNLDQCYLAACSCRILVN